MERYCLTFLKKTFEILKREALPYGPTYLLFLPKKGTSYFDRKFWAKNAANAERNLNLPQAKWDETTTAFRKLFGVHEFLEALFMMGFVLGWVESKASLSGNFARRLHTKACASPLKADG